LLFPILRPQRQRLLVHHAVLVALRHSWTAPEAVRVQWAIVGRAKPHLARLVQAAPQAMRADRPQIAPWRMILAAQRASSGLVALVRYLTPVDVMTCQEASGAAFFGELDLNGSLPRR